MQKLVGRDMRVDVRQTTNVVSFLANIVCQPVVINNNVWCKKHASLSELLR